MSDVGEFHRQVHPHGRGRSAEAAGAAWLAAHGFDVLERNVSTPAGEIDLIALDGDTLCFVEIKARSSAVCGPAIAAVGRQKQRRLGRAAALYLTSSRHAGPCRFDVLGLDPGGDEEWDFTLVKNAFELPAS